MCTLLIIKNRIARLPLLLAANRDEVFSRPFKGPELDEYNGILCPVDVSKGGTWIGANRAGSVAAITNRPVGQPHPDRRSRGLLCLDALRSDNLAQARERTESAVAKEDYNGFNLLLCDREQAWLLTHTPPRGLIAAPLDDGCHVLTNRHDLDPTELEDVRRGLEEVAREAQDIGVCGGEVAVARLAGCLADHTERVPDAHAICKHGPSYGTVCGTIIGLTDRGCIELYFASGPPCRTDFARAGRLMSE